MAHLHAPGAPHHHPQLLRAVGLALAIALLAWSAVANLGIGDHGYLGRNLALTAGLLLLARSLRLTWAELGLARADLATGVRWGAVATSVVGVAVVLGVLLADHVPVIASLLGDQRAALPTDELVYHAGLRIPAGTALFEELAFRGVLFAVLLRLSGPWQATLLSSVVFGLWHVAPTIVALEVNDVVATEPAGVGAIVGAVAVTAAAGVAFSVLRWRSRSLVAPILAHWATNALGLLAAAAAHRG
jgi:uncharacterized protein